MDAGKARVITMNGRNNEHMRTKLMDRLKSKTLNERSSSKYLSYMEKCNFNSHMELKVLPIQNFDSWIEKKSMYIYIFESILLQMLF